jgi:hypothetical protein
MDEKKKKKKRFSIKRAQCTNKRKNKYSNFRLRFSTSCQFQSGKNNTFAKILTN